MGSGAEVFTGRTSVLLGLIDILLQSDSVPFLGIGVTTHLFQPLGIPSPFHTLLKSGSNISSARSGRHMKI